MKNEKEIIWEPEVIIAVTVGLCIASLALNMKYENQRIIERDKKKVRER